MYSPLLLKEINEDNVLACYFFYGEETYPADHFVSQLHEMLTASSGEDMPVTRLYLDESKWMEIIDTARTAPFLFQQWRVIAVRLPERKGGAEPAGRKKGESESDGDEERGTKFLNETDQKIIREYCASPAARTTLVVIMAGRVRKTDTVVRFFSSLPKTAVMVKEIKPLRPGAVKEWAEKKALALGKTLTAAANNRLYEIVGSDLRLLANELEKLAVFVADKRRIDEDDVDQATAWVRSFATYELDDALTAADLDKAITILDSLMAEGEKAEVIIGRLAGFFRNVLTAQTLVREKARSREDIFQAFFPYIPKFGGNLYSDKFSAFFRAVDGMSPAEVNAALRELAKADIKIKTSDAAPRTVFEVFLEGYCLARRMKKTI